MLADAYSQFLSPCLTDPTFVNYGANFPGWLALFSALLVQLLEYGAMTRQFAILEKNMNALPITEKIDASDNEANDKTMQLTLEDAVGHIHVPGFADAQEVCSFTQF